MRRLMYDFLFIGNEHPIKGIKTLEYILERIGNRYTVALVGKLPATQKKYGGMSNFHFFGVVKGKQKLEIIAKSTLAFVPSYHESFSMVISECLLVGVPVVAFDMPTLRSVYKHGVVFVEYKNDEAMYRKMRFLANNHKKIQLLTQDILSHARKYRWDEEARKVL